MLLRLTRTEYLSSGIFGKLESEDKALSLVTLEHAYEAADNISGHYSPKIPHGEYVCVRGLHRLEHMDHDFETFEITGVEGHSNILFHVGNFNKDSSGCVLLGLTRHYDSLANSSEAFSSFMRSLVGLDSFKLAVS